MKKLTLIVGAGASAEYGLPVGAQLKDKISDVLNFKFEHGYMRHGDEVMNQAIRLAHRVKQDDLNAYFRAAGHIRSALPQAISIDNFIDCQADEKVELVGKLAIVRSILMSEKRSALYINRRGNKGTLDFNAIRGNWLTALDQLLTQNCGVQGVVERLKSLCFVIFNYDRCVEHFLFHSLQNYYRITAVQAADILRQVEFLHPYGTVGRLPWQSEHDYVEFGEEVESEKLLKNAERIRTFTEGTDPDSSEIVSVRNGIMQSERLLFLGFAYHQLNMRLIAPSGHAGDGRRRYCFGTAYLMSNFDTAAIAGEIVEMQRSSERDVHIRNDLKCADVFREYTRGISID